MPKGLHKTALLVAGCLSVGIAGVLGQGRIPHATMFTFGKSPRIHMATCPRCMGALTENHRCPKGRFSGVGTALVTLGIGSIVGVLLCYSIEGQPAGPLVLSSAALGAVLAYATRQAISPKS